MTEFANMLMRSAKAGKPAPEMGGKPGVTIDDRKRYNTYLEQYDNGDIQGERLSFEDWRKKGKSEQ